MFHKTLIASLMTMCIMTACGGESAKNTPAPQQDSAATTTTASSNLPVVKVGTDASYPPFQFRDDKNTIMGIEPDLLKYIGEKQGFTVDLQHGERKNWAATFKGNVSDMWSSAFYQNNQSQYAENADVTKPFMEAYIVVALCDDVNENKSIQSTNQLQGKKIAVSKYYGQPMIDLATKLTGSAENVMVVDTFYLSARELYNKRVDAVLGANYVLSYFADQMKKTDTTRYIRVESEAPRQLVFLVKKGNTDLLNKLNAGIDQAQADGTLKKLHEKWLGSWRAEKANFQVVQ